MTNDEKVRENRARRLALRLGYRIYKNPVRESRAPGFGTYRLVRDHYKKTVCCGETLDTIEQALERV